MHDDFVIARNPDDASTLPYILRIPLGEHGILLKARETWPRTSKVYCHRVEEWPAEAEIVERVPVRSCVRRGAAVDLVLERGRENRSQFVVTTVRGGRQVIFWQTARTTKQARPRVSTPTARASGLSRLDIVVDTSERYAWKFSEQQAETSRSRLPAGDYGVFSGADLVAAVERKSMGDLISSMTGGKLKYQLADLSAVRRAALVVEDRYSRAFQHEVVSAAVVADGLAECQVAFPNVPIVFCETRKLAQEWTYRFLAASLVSAVQDAEGSEVVGDLAQGDAVPSGEPTVAEVRAWAAAQGLPVSDRGRLRADVITAYHAAHPPD